MILNPPSLMSFNPFIFCYSSLYPHPPNLNYPSTFLMSFSLLYVSRLQTDWSAPLLLHFRAMKLQCPLVATIVYSDDFCFLFFLKKILYLVCLCFVCTFFLFLPYTKIQMIDWIHRHHSRNSNLYYKFFTGDELIIEKSFHPWHRGV